MIRPGHMGNICGPGSGHVAARAILVFLMMRGSKCRLSMAGEASPSVESNALIGPRSEVGIVAAHARHCVTAPALAGALAQLLNFAHPARVGVRLIVNIESQVS